MTASQGTKTINVVFEDGEFDDLLEVKGDLSWHDFIIAKALAKARVK